ncbi:hypothetical protein Syun_028120 [Stephania yunnanensis]|uniref:Uncharacterized protein n=1 Tax=Stephania yunnanensis TaxID=152371 RepID=A0AAP0HNF8_9MAGN
MEKSLDDRRCKILKRATPPGCGYMVERRSANYHPNIWDFDFIESLNIGYKGEIFDGQVEKLEKGVRQMLNDKNLIELAQLELIDNLLRLGIGYIFESEIQRILSSIADNKKSSLSVAQGLHGVALRFKLLRLHGYEISAQDAFHPFKDENGDFKACLRKDVEGILSLYDASHLSLEGEDVLDEAKHFTTKHLKEVIKGNIVINSKLASRVSHSLELPLHWRMLRLEARWYIEACSIGVGGGDGISPDLIQLAMLDFNRVQAVHQKNLKKASRWWRDLGLCSHPEMHFARDRLVENFLWTIGIIFDPQFSYCRDGLTKVNSLITTIDDVYDVYGSLEELELFTVTVERWDIAAMEQLPKYMKLCFLALFNTVNQMAYVILKEQDLDISLYLKKAWADLCKAYLVEARWFHNKYTPTLEEYLENAWVSISAPVMLVHSYFFVKQEITTEALQCLDRYPDIIRWSSMILRLCDDLGTATAELERGDVAKSIQCYMKETGVSEEVAREYIKHLIGEIWKKLNKERVDYSLFSKPFIGTAVNLARMAQCMYQYGDGHGDSDGYTKNRVMSLLVEPLSL